MDIRIPLAFVLVLAALPARADFHDQGMHQKPAVKTEYVDPKTGTAGHPLVIGTCLWGNCRTERLVFQQSNAWQQNMLCDPCTGPPRPDSYWVVLLNNEPRADPNNSGPHDASLPRAAPGNGFLGFATARGSDGYWRAHLVLDFITYSNPVFGGIPFLGFGEFSARGNRNRTIGYLQPSASTRPSVLSFAARLWQAVPPMPIAGTTQPATLASYVWLLANWGTKPKAIFITLYHWNIQNSNPPANPAIYHFSWPISQSALYPGVNETLERLGDFQLAVLTNKPIRFSRTMLDGLGVLHRFAAVYGGNSFERKKPDPVGIFQILSDTKAQPEQTWMIGDSAVDVLTGRNAGVKTCGVSWGYATDSFKTTPPDFLIHRFEELEELVRLDG